MQRGLERFLSTQLGQDAIITDLRRPIANGFSAETYILDVEVPEAAEPAVHRLVVQAAPRGPALFEDYDLTRCFAVQSALADLGVPVAPMRWLSEDESWIGAPFYVMDFVEGLIPPDKPPYHLGGWLFDSPAADRATIWRAGVVAMGNLHRAPIERFSFLGEDHQLDEAGQRLERWRNFGAGLGADAEPTLLGALERLGRDRPAPGELRVHWGDAKLGNMIFHQGRAAAILDWELCGLSVGEEDLAHWLAVDWLLSTGLGNQRLAGLPGPTETIDLYESTVGRATSEVAWWFVFALVRMGLIFQRAAVQSRLRKAERGPLRPNVIVPHVSRLLDGRTWADYCQVGDERPGDAP